MDVIYYFKNSSYLHHDRDSSYPEWQVATPAKNNSNKKKG